ncbi:hypothetical protein ABID14_001748 [Peptoniphilus olsenii]|uniref:Uncharacterized protein n=1 Tax=Peptoniphilus olsenii TaxID=411570 RepID=A0ABV2JBH1_9FIRM
MKIVINWVTLPIEIGLGFALGIVLDNIWLWMAIGTAIGVVFGIRSYKSEKED